MSFATNNILLTCNNTVAMLLGEKWQITSLSCQRVIKHEFKTNFSLVIGGYKTITELGHLSVSHRSITCPNVTTEEPWYFGQPHPISVDD